MAIDYDPVKAHEYYEKHKKLKGRKKSYSTKNWSKTKQKQWMYVQAQLKEEHDKNKQGITEAAKASRQALANEAKTVIAALREKLKGLPKAQKMALKTSVQGMIDNIREKLKLDKAAVTEAAQGKRVEENEAYEQRKEEAYKTLKKMKNPKIKKVVKKLTDSGASEAKETKDNVKREDVKPKLEEAKEKKKKKK